MEVEITTRGDVIVIVDLPRSLPIPIHLVLVYRDTENPSTPPDSKITQAAYLNTSAIRHIDFASQVPFEHFTAEVGLFSENVRGPLIRAQGEFGERAGYINLSQHNLKFGARGTCLYLFRIIIASTPQSELFDCLPASIILTTSCEAELNNRLAITWSVEVETEEYRLS